MFLWALAVYWTACVGPCDQGNASELAGVRDSSAPEDTPTPPFFLCADGYDPLSTPALQNCYWPKSRTHRSSLIRGFGSKYAAWSVFLIRIGFRVGSGPVAMGWIVW